jgi:hypothetical protein
VGAFQTNDLFICRHFVYCVASQLYISFKNYFAGLRAESTVSGDWSVEEMSKVLFEESRELYDLCAKTFNDASISIGDQNMDLERANTPEKRFIFLTLGMVS